MKNSSIFDDFSPLIWLFHLKSVFLQRKNLLKSVFFEATNRLKSVKTYTRAAENVKYGS